MVFTIISIPSRNCASVIINGGENLNAPDPMGLEIIPLDFSSLFNLQTLDTPSVNVIKIITLYYIVCLSSKQGILVIKITII